MSVPESGKSLPSLLMQRESPPPPKWRCIAHIQAGQESFIIRPGKQKQSRTDNNSSTSHSRADASSSSSDHPQLHAPSSEFNPSLPLLDPPPARRCGMDEEQVKYARNLVTVSHAVIKFLGLVFTLPAVYGLFDDQDLGFMVTQVLAIPLTPELPTPNSRKTCALVIWLLQTQRLPADGELRKEGKKGSVSNGMKAIHNLSIHEPFIFVPAFTELLPSVLDNLLALRLALQTQACHALGGLALGASQIPLSHIHTWPSEIINAVLTYTSSSSPASPPRMPSAGKSDSMLIKTMRMTARHAQSVAPALVTSIKLTNAVKALLTLSVQHRKSSVCALAFLLNLHARAHQTTDQSDDEDSEDALEGDAVEAANCIDHETDDFWSRGDVDMEGDADPRDWHCSPSRVHHPSD
ncbi:hypothetical protein F5888DRAFT_1800813 [Russula emetica]|nr:hypothetical protein F5888DRAFT_1800813 [Russula emetica]